MSNTNPFLKQKQKRSIDQDAILLDRFRALFHEKSVRQLSNMFNKLCSLGCAEPGARMSLAEFKKGMEKFVSGGKEIFSALDLAKIFYMINTDGTGKLLLKEFVQNIQGSMSMERQKVVLFVFSHLKNESSGCIEEIELANYLSENKECPMSSNADIKADSFIREYGMHGKISQQEFIDYYLHLNFLTQNDRAQFIKKCLNDWGLTRSDYEKANPRPVVEKVERKTIVKPTSPVHVSPSMDTVDAPTTKTNVTMKVKSMAGSFLSNLISNKKGTSHRHDDMGMTRRGHDVYTQKEQRFDILNQPVPASPGSPKWPYTHPSYVDGLCDELQPTIVPQALAAINKDMKPHPAPLMVVASELQKETLAVAKGNMDKFDALARLALADKAVVAAQNPRDGRSLNVSIHCKSLHGYGSSSNLVPKPPSMGSPRKRGTVAPSASDNTDGSGNSRDNVNGSFEYSPSDCSPIESADNTRSTSPITMAKDHSTLNDPFVKNSSHHAPRASSSRPRHDYDHYANIEITDYELDRSISGHRDDMDRSVSGHTVAKEGQSQFPREPSSSHGLGGSRHGGLGGSRHGGLGGSKHGALHASFADQSSPQFSDHLAAPAFPSIHPTTVGTPSSATVPILKRQTSSRNCMHDSFATTSSTAPPSQQSPQHQQPQALFSKTGGEPMVHISQRDVEAIMKRLSDLEHTVSSLQKQVKEQQVVIAGQQQSITSHTQNMASFLDTKN